MKKVLACIVCLALAACISDQTEKEGGEFLGYIDEFGTSVERYAVDGTCDCDSSYDDDCEYWYGPATWYCNALDFWFYDAALSNWSESYGHFFRHTGSGSLTVTCGFPFKDETFFDGEVALKFYGVGLSAAASQLNVSTGATTSVGNCSVGSSYSSCSISSIDLNATSGYLFLEATVTLQGDEELLGIRTCLDDDA